MKGIGKMYEEYKKVVKHKKALSAADCTLSGGFWQGRRHRSAAHHFICRW